MDSVSVCSGEFVTLSVCLSVTQFDRVYHRVLVNVVCHTIRPGVHRVYVLAVLCLCVTQFDRVGSGGRSGWVVGSLSVIVCSGLK